MHQTSRALHATPIQASAGNHGQATATTGADSLVARAWQAGRAVGTAAQDRAWSNLLLADDIAEVVRERLGYAVHVIAEAKYAGATPAELWQRVQSNLGAAEGKPLELSAVDDARLGLLAFAAGLCDEDKQVSSGIDQYVAMVVRGRLFVTG